MDRSARVRRHVPCLPADGSSARRPGARSDARAGEELFGVIALRRPDVATATLALVFAVYVFADAFLDFVLAERDRESRWMLGLAGALSIILGIMLLANTAAGASAAIWTIGIYAIIYGVAIFALGMRVLAEAQHVRELRGPGPAVPST